MNDSKQEAQAVLDKGDIGFVASVTTNGEYHAKTFIEPDQFPDNTAAARMGVMFHDSLKNTVRDLDDKIHERMTND